MGSLLDTCAALEAHTVDLVRHDAHEVALGGAGRTEDAVTKADGVWVTFGLIVGLYVLLGVALVLTLRAMARR